ncbi:MAG: DUF4190 domain-containing protein [Actinobacteria bacterium]|nr:DUF4190 domain-containing protein [Actinomycetota bacterium]
MVRQPTGRYSERWWTGIAWSDAVKDVNGLDIVDPVNGAQAPVAQTVHSLAAPAPMMPTGPVAYPAQAQTPNLNLPGGGAWAAPQQLVVTNASKSPGTAIAALVLGVGAFFVSLVPLLGWFSIPFAIVGLGLGISGVLRANKGFEGRGMAITGIVASVAALFVSAVYFFAVGAAVGEEVNSDRSDGVCDESRFFQDPDC